MTAHAVLIVEDDEDIRHALCDVIQDAGYQTRGAANGWEAMQLLQQMPKPCVVILDLMMPVMDGPTFMTRAADSNMQIPIVIVTARPVYDVHHEVITKPFDASQVLAAVKRYCDPATTEDK